MLTRAEKFKDARVVHNQHGKQTMDAVFEATGVNKSIISALERDAKGDGTPITQGVGYDKVVKLAEHYGVSLDYLLSSSDDPKRKPSAVDELDLTPRYIGAITRRKNSDSDTHWAITRRVLEISELKIAAAVHDCVIAKKSHDEYERVFMMYDKEQSDHFCFGSGDKYNIIHQKAAEEITKKMDNGEYSPELLQSLSRQIRYSDEDSLLTPSIADMTRIKLMDVIDDILDFLGKDEKVKSLLGLSNPPKYEITYDEEMTRNAQEYEKQQQSNTMF